MNELQKELTITIEDLEIIRMAGNVHRETLLDKWKKDAGCNGWVNRETWQTNQYFMQNEPLYRAFLLRANHLLSGNGSIRINKNVPLQDCGV